MLEKFSLQNDKNIYKNGNTNGEFSYLCQFCLLVCSVCTFFTVLGSYIPGVVLSYVLRKYGLFSNQFMYVICSLFDLCTESMFYL